MCMTWEPGHAGKSLTIPKIDGNPAGLLCGADDYDNGMVTGLIAIRQRTDLLKPSEQT